MQITEHRCDRCSKQLDLHRAQTITVNYHHPRTLELCSECEGEFTLWLGKHPLWGTTVEQMQAGTCVGDGYPSREQLQRVGA